MLADLGLEHVADARDRESGALVGDQQHRLEAAEIAVGAPVLRQLDAGAGELAGILFELRLEPLEQGEGVGGRAGKACDHLALR